MTTNPNLLFALESIATKAPVSTLSNIPTAIATPFGPHRALARAKDPRHGCINGIKISTCKTCAGHVLRTKATCTGCKGTGFSGARCNACAIDAVVALRVLIKEVAADIRAGDVKTAKAPDKEASTGKEVLKAKDTAETETVRDESGSDKEAKTFETDESSDEA